MKGGRILRFELTFSIALWYYVGMRGTYIKKKKGNVQHPTHVPGAHTRTTEGYAPVPNIIDAILIPPFQNSQSVLNDTTQLNGRSLIPK